MRLERKGSPDVNTSAAVTVEEATSARCIFPPTHSRVLPNRLSLVSPCRGVLCYLLVICSSLYYAKEGRGRRELSVADVCDWLHRYFMYVLTQASPRLTGNLDSQQRHAHQVDILVSSIEREAQVCTLSSVPWA